MHIPEPKFLISIRHIITAAKGKGEGGAPAFKIGVLSFDCSVWLVDKA